MFAFDWSNDLGGRGERVRQPIVFETLCALPDGAGDTAVCEVTVLDQVLVLVSVQGEDTSDRLFFRGFITLSALSKADG